MFDNLTPPALDPILAISAQFKTDQRPDKIDLGIGIYKNEANQTPIMAAIKEAEHRLIETEDTKAYIGIAGREKYNRLMMDLVLPDDAALMQRTACIQTVGGSGALRNLTDLIHNASPNARVWLSKPSYANHEPVVDFSQLNKGFYRYLDQSTQLVNVEQMLEDLAQAEPGDVVLLHACCHNPSGADLTDEDWIRLAHFLKQKQLIPFVDLAYHGLGRGLEQDLFGLHQLISVMDHLLLSVSASKNFGLYRERTGAAMVVTPSAEQARLVKQKLQTLARGTISMPPDHGAALVEIVLSDAKLTEQWKAELSQMQQRLRHIRHLFADALATETNSQRFEFIRHHQGMFSMLGLSKDKMKQLVDDYGIYAVPDSRINIAGVTESQIPYIAKAIASLL